MDVGWRCSLNYSDDPSHNLRFEVNTRRKSDANHVLLSPNVVRLRFAAGKTMSAEKIASRIFKVTRDSITSRMVNRSCFFVAI